MTFEKTQKLLNQAIQDKVTPGAVIGVLTGGESHFFAAGNRRWIPSEQPVEVGTPYDLASVSKILMTTTLIGLLVDRGWLRFSTRVKSILPEFHSREIEISHLLSHTAGCVWWKPYYDSIRAEFPGEPLENVHVEDRRKLMREFVLSTPLEAKPLERVVYSDVSFLTLGFLIEEVLQSSLKKAAESLIFHPLSLNQTFITETTKSVAAGRLEKVAATENCPWRGGVLQGQVHDDNAWSMGGYGGHAGVFSTAGDVLKWFQGIRSGLLSRETLQAFSLEVPFPHTARRTLGWDMPSGDLPGAGLRFSKNSVGHNGFTGTSFWFDPTCDLAVVLLSNRVHPSRDQMEFRKLRSQIHDAIYSDFETIDGQ